MVVLDTNIIIDHIRQFGSESLLERLHKKIPEDNLAISIISIEELYRGQSTKEPEAEKILLATLGSLKVLPYTYEIAELAGKLIRDSSQILEFADAAIAATAIVNSASLFTLNKKDFAQISNLELLDI